MSAEGHVGELCAAFGCPLLGSFGVSGMWYCCCHFRADVTARDAITAELHRHQNLVDAALLARRTFAGWAAIKEAEDQLQAITFEIGRQYAMEAKA